MGASIAAPVRPRKQDPMIPNGVFGMMLFAFTESMLFAGAISAYIITKAEAPGGVWPPPWQPRLPVESTAINTTALLISGYFLWVAHRTYRRGPALKARVPLALSVLLGVYFIVAQGREWVDLLAQGLTLTSSSHGAFFYLLVGLHGIHAVAALIGLTWVLAQLWRGRLKPGQFYAAQVFWYFVVGLWPFLYWQVYLL